MIARVEPPFKPTPQQRRIKQLLQQMTGLGVTVTPYQNGPYETVCYTFKCDVPKGVDEEAQAAPIHQLYDYVADVLVRDAQAAHESRGDVYNYISLFHRADPQDPRDSMWPCVGVCFSDVMGVPHDDATAVRIAERMLAQVREVAAQEYGTQNLAVYTQQRRDGKSFADGYVKELGQ